MLLARDNGDSSGVLFEDEEVVTRFERALATVFNKVMDDISSAR